jgi:hypothetical protein
MFQNRGSLESGGSGQYTFCIGFEDVASRPPAVQQFQNAVVHPMPGIFGSVNRQKPDLHIMCRDVDPSGEKQ